MTFTFSNVSAEKFSINGRTLFKTFIPVYIDDNHIIIFNIYDSKLSLIPTTNVSEIEVNGVTYTTSTDLINNIHDVLFSRTVSGSINEEQIELNRVSIIELQLGKANIDHAHNDIYYTKKQVDIMLSELPSVASIDNAIVDGEFLRFYSRGSQVFNTNVKNFLEQGISLSFEKNKLNLKNAYGQKLSSVEISSKESYYGEFEFQNNQEDDLTDLVQNKSFTLAKTLRGSYFFVSKSTNKEVFSDSRIYFNEIDEFLNLEKPSIENNEFKAWEINITDENYIAGTNYKFNFWYQNLDLDFDETTATPYEKYITHST